MTTLSTHKHGMQQAALHSNQAVGGYSGFLSILIGLCSLPFLALRAVVDFFAPPSAAELLTRHQGANGHPAWPQSAVTPTPLATTEQPLSPACEATPPHATPKNWIKPTTWPSHHIGPYGRRMCRARALSRHRGGWRLSPPNSVACAQHFEMPAYAGAPVKYSPFPKSTPLWRSNA